MLCKGPFFWVKIYPSHIHAVFNFHHCHPLNCMLFCFLSTISLSHFGVRISLILSSVYFSIILYCEYQTYAWIVCSNSKQDWLSFYEHGILYSFIRRCFRRDRHHHYIWRIHLRCWSFLIIACH